jgi:hypothetical protein
MPYGVRDIEVKGHIDGDRIQCHIKECLSVVRKPTKVNLTPPDSLCKTHGIYVHGNKYRYQDWTRNIIWPETERITWHANNKREGRKRRVDSLEAGNPERMGNENSEDAVTWNVFWGFDRMKSVGELLPVLTGGEVATSKSCRAFYWTLEHPAGIWAPFARASAYFGEPALMGTEVDVILHDEGRCLIFVEAKFGSGNKVPATNSSRYTGTPWFKESMKSFPQFQYELARNWVIGSYLATEILKVPFWLISLVREEAKAEATIEDRFYRTHCRPRAEWHFCRVTWEEIARVGLPMLPEPERGVMGRYFQGKTLNLKPAFAFS